MISALSTSSVHLSVYASGESNELSERGDQVAEIS